MVNKFFCSLNLLVLAGFFGLFHTTDARAMSAEQFFADANRLYRDDLYWAALLRYRQAAEEGLNTPLLHYNLGVAHYRAGQYARARESLLKALEDPSLRIVSEYNLGLAAYAQGETEAALRWFRLARDQQQNKKIQRFAVVAIARIRDQEAQPDEYQVRAIEREKKRNFTNLEFSAEVGFGNDDNVFRSPDQVYVDLADPATPLVTPDVTSAAYLPVSLGVKYKVNSLKFEGFYVGYRLSGRYYQDQLLENANEYQQEVSFGSEYRRKEGSREREVYSAFKVAQHDETYYDPDDGGIRSVDGIDIGNRLDYLRYGPELTLRQSHERLAIGAKFKGQLWNYDETTAVPEYDHEYFLLSLYGQYKITSSSLVRITAEGYSRRYTDRPAFDLDGGQRIANPDIRYDYYSLAFTARQRVFDSFWFGFDVQRTERIDQYLGYNDYTRDNVGAEFHWTPGERLDFEAKGVYYLYNYPNAFAFHNPAAERKTQESVKVGVAATFQMTRHLSIVAEANYRETVSNDTRIQYERNQYTIGVRWEQ